MAMAVAPEQEQAAILETSLNTIEKENERITKLLSQTKKRAKKRLVKIQSTEKKLHDATVKLKKVITPKAKEKHQAKVLEFAEQLLHDYECINDAVKENKKAIEQVHNQYTIFQDRTLRYLTQERIQNARKRVNDPSSHIFFYGNDPYDSTFRTKYMNDI